MTNIPGTQASDGVPTYLGKALGTTVKAIEARNYGAKTADQT